MDGPRVHAHASDASWWLHEPQTGFVKITVHAGDTDGNHIHLNASLRMNNQFVRLQAKIAAWVRQEDEVVGAGGHSLQLLAEQDNGKYNYIDPLSTPDDLKLTNFQHYSVWAVPHQPGDTSTPHMRLFAKTMLATHAPGKLPRGLLEALLHISSVGTGSSSAASTSRSEYLAADITKPLFDVADVVAPPVGQSLTSATDTLELAHPAAHSAPAGLGHLGHTVRKHAAHAVKRALAAPRRKQLVAAGTVGLAGGLLWAAHGVNKDRAARAARAARARAARVQHQHHHMPYGYGPMHEPMP